VIAPVSAPSRNGEFAGGAGDGPRDLRSLLTSGTVHFMGIGGAGMCALAEAVVRQGGRVTGCDRSPGGAVRNLERMGVRIRGGHDPSHVEEAVALVVSAAVPDSHPEIRAAREAGLPVLKRAEALGGWVNQGTLVAVAGTHGKTTATAMATSVLETAGMDPTGFIGGETTQWRGHLRAGSDDLFVVEADEYDRSFHHLRPSVALVTNLEADHLDIYGDLEGVRRGFRRFLEGVRHDGAVVVCGDDPGASALLPWVGERGWSYGLSAGSRLRGTRVRLREWGSACQVLEEGVSRGRLELRVPGVHNVRNALGVAAACRRLGVEWEAIRQGLAAYEGVRRRFQELGRVGGIRVVDDYAHHPTEVEAVLAAARAAAPRARIVAVFQPHLYSRTRDFAGEFGRALALADVVWVTEVYPAREEPIPGVDGALVARAVEGMKGMEGARVTEVLSHGELDSLPEALAAFLRKGDLCLTMGAGSIESVGPALVEALEGREGSHA
jgi:UDP-N-acetylmuramate--alanine ligase